MRKVYRSVMTLPGFMIGDKENHTHETTNDVAGNAGKKNRKQADAADVQRSGVSSGSDSRRDDGTGAGEDGRTGCT